MCVDDRDDYFLVRSVLDLSEASPRAVEIAIDEFARQINEVAEKTGAAPRGQLQVVQTAAGHLVLLQPMEHGYFTYQRQRRDLVKVVAAALIERSPDPFEQRMQIAYNTQLLVDRVMQAESRVDDHDAQEFERLFFGKKPVSDRCS